MEKGSLNIGLQLPASVINISSFDLHQVAERGGKIFYFFNLNYWYAEVSIYYIDLYFLPTRSRNFMDKG
jgi:hypothetical protein